MSDKERAANSVQLDTWTGEFGNRYIERNSYEPWKLPLGVTAFERMLGSISLDSILEVGSNIGQNLIYLSALRKGRGGLYAVEPNRKAFETLNANPDIALEQSWNCDAFSLPLDDASVDLAFTAGVLIHISPDDLLRATSEIVRVSRRYVLCEEYFSHDQV